MPIYDRSDFRPKSQQNLSIYEWKDIRTEKTGDTQE